MNVHHVYPYRSTQRECLQRRLSELGVQTLCHYPVPLHRQACFGGEFDRLELPEAERIAAEELSLPMSPTMTEEDARYVVRAVHAAQEATEGEAQPQAAAWGRSVPFLDLKDVNARYVSELNDAARRVIDGGWYIGGEECHLFEQEFASYCADKSGRMSLHCVGCGNGLDALTLILTALRQRYGWTAESEVIVPAMTFVATGQAVVRAGLTLRLCDVTPEGLMDPMSAAMAITDHTVALLPVHLYGQRADLDTLSELASIHGLTIVQDAAQAHGLPLDYGEGGGIVAAFSFYPGKNLGALGDGGAVVTDDELLAAHVRSLANYGAAEKYHHDLPEACNSRLDALQAALLRVKLRHLDEDNAQRLRIAAIYDAELKR